MDSPSNPFADGFNESVVGGPVIEDGGSISENGGCNNNGGNVEPFSNYLFPLMSQQTVPPPQTPHVQQQQRQQQQQQRQQDDQLSQLPTMSPPPVPYLDENNDRNYRGNIGDTTNIPSSFPSSQQAHHHQQLEGSSTAAPRNESTNSYSAEQMVVENKKEHDLFPERQSSVNSSENASDSNSYAFACFYQNQPVPMDQRGQQQRKQQQLTEHEEHQQPEQIDWNLTTPMGLFPPVVQSKDNLNENNNENENENQLFSTQKRGLGDETGTTPLSATASATSASTKVALTQANETSEATEGVVLNKSTAENDTVMTTEVAVQDAEARAETMYTRENSGDRRIDYTPYGAFADNENENDNIVNNIAMAKGLGIDSLGQSITNPFDEAINGSAGGNNNEGASKLSANEKSRNEIGINNGSYNSDTNSNGDSTQKLVAMRSNHSSSFTTFTEGESWKSDDDNSSSSDSSSDFEESQEIKRTDEELLLRKSKGDDFNASSRGRSLTPRKSIHIDDSTDEEGDGDGTPSLHSNESEEVETRLRYASVAAAKRSSYPEEEDVRVGGGGDDSEGSSDSSRGAQSSDGSFFTKRFKGGVDEDDLVSVTFNQEQSHDDDEHINDDKDSSSKQGFNSDSAARHSTMSQEELDSFLHPLMDFEDDYSDTRLRDATSDGMATGMSTGNDEESAFTGAPSVHASQPSRQSQQENQPSSSPNRKRKRKNDSQKAFYIIMIVSITAVALCLGAFIYFWFLPYLDKLEARKKSNNEMWQLPPSVSPPKSPDTQVLTSPFLNESAPCAYFTMSLLTDSYGNETTWQLLYYGDVVNGDNTTGAEVAVDSRLIPYLTQNDESNRLRRHIPKHRRAQELIEPAIVATGGPYAYVDTTSHSYDPETSGRHIASMCLPEGRYKFLLKDVNGDGICCNYGLGSYGLYFNGGRDIRPTSIAEFVASEETEFQVTEEDVILANTSTSPSISLAPTASDHPSSIPSTTPTYLPHSLLSMQTVRNINALSGISKSHGLLFDIETNANISSLNVVSMELLIDSQGPIEYEIWTKKGSRHELDLTDPNFYTAFYKVSEGIINASGVCETCGFSPIPLDQFQDVLIEGWRTRQAFWISLKQNSLVFQEYKEEQEIRDLQVISQIAIPEFEVYYGTAVLYEPINMVNPGQDFRGVMGFLGKIWYQANFMNESSVNTSSPIGPVQENNETTIILPSNPPLNISETNHSIYTSSTEEHSGDSPLNNTQSYESNETSGILPSNSSSYIPETNPSNSSLPMNIFPGAYTPIPSFFPTFTPTFYPQLNGSSVLNIIPTLSPTASSQLNASSLPPYNPLNDSNIPPGTTQLVTDISYPYTFSIAFQGNLAPSRFGSSVAVSTDGKVLAIGATGAINGFGTPSGAVYIYEINSDGVNGTSQTWLQTIFGESSGDEFGCAVSMSQFGNEIVVGSRSEMGLTGAMRVFRRANNTWSIQGDPIFGVIEGGQAGWSVAISGDGQIAVMGIPKGGANRGGSVQAFIFGLDEISYDMAWIPYGNPVDGLVNGEETGYSISLTQDGGTLVVGSPKASSPSGHTFAGKASVNWYNGSDWVLVGQEMFGESRDDNYGTSVALSQDGTVLLIGSKGKDVNDTANVGQCSLYELTESSFGSSSYSLLGELPEEHLGSFVAVSPDSSIVACGGVNGNFDGSANSGVVRVFNRKNQEESTVWPKTDAMSSWDAALFGSSIALSSNGNYLVVGAPGWSDGSEGSVNGSLQIFEDSS